MNSDNTFLSDGDLYRLEQDAIRRAIETASRSQFPEGEVKGISFTPKRGKKGDIGNLFKNLLGNFKADDLILIALFFLLVNEGADEDIILLIVLLFVLGLG